MKQAFETLPLFQELKHKKVPKRFLFYICENTVIEEIAIASAGSGLPTETWFHRLLTMTDDDKLKSFDNVCQKLIAKALHYIRETCFVGNRSRFSNFWYQVYNGIDKEDLFANDGPFSELPTFLQDNQTGKYILFEIIVHLIEGWANELSIHAREKELVKEINELTTEERNRQINGYVGFALASTINIYREKKHKALLLEDIEEDEKDCKSKEHFENVKKFLLKMRILHSEALQNHEYSLSYYADSNKMLNHGGLTLISPKYFEFATLLMSLCHREMREKTIYARAGTGFKLAKDALFRNEKLKEAFDRAHLDNAFSPLMKEEVDRIYQMLLVKTLRAKFGAAMKSVRENKVGYFAKKSNQETLRGDLKHQNKKKMKEEGSKLMEEAKKRKR